ncbi:winged helix DNA-binding domain-containing protein [Aquihabitans sp. McL0605]|uniref:winged helix DNA-binding domain-containing protein n=1 Tax=Aquihabitans sp. McL0605 TaxID=3415671 RepID=UPI003CF792A8
MTPPKLTRSQVIAFRLRQHQLDAPSPDGQVGLLDYGVQDTGPDGAAWALAIRGATAPPHDVAYAWTLRGAPHAYRRADLAAVATATAPYDEDDASKRIFDASKPLKAAGISTLDALREVAAQLRELAAKPIVKGDASGALGDLLGQPFLRYCRVCEATHIYELPFRLAALQAGLELEAGTSPPILRRAPKLKPADFQHLAGEARPEHDVIRNHLRFYGPATMKDVAAFVDMPLKTVKAHWPTDATEVSVTGASGPTGSPPRFLLDEHVAEATGAEPPSPEGVALLGPFDPYLQGRDRELLVHDAARRKALWPTIGRPGAMVAGGEVVATWRPKTANGKLTIRLEPWTELTPAVRAGIEAESARLADHRGVTLAGIVDE